MTTATRSSSTPRLVFISHNNADKDISRSLAQALIDQGIGVWFDEWNLGPGDSITAGIQGGLAATDLAVIVWSKNAAKSRWVTEELAALIHRRTADSNLRVVPVMLDETPLPLLLADSLGYRLAAPKDALEIAAKIGGNATAAELARRLQERFFEMLDRTGQGVCTFDYKFCPMCGATELEGWQQADYKRDDIYAGIRCKKCGWGDGGEV